ncbi:hypothetical protein CL655_04185 [bacterium]|nr:hypothetical protein [bacterium]|tara:strand:+ start:1030 stop:1299 length:270 start_codon:yes stop_codon:yes gene_type:complete
MSRESLIMLLGLVIVFLPSLGVPSQWKEYGLLGAGIALILVGYSLRRSMYLRTIDRGNGERGTDAFLEHDGSTPKVVTEATSEETQTVQ